MQITGRARIKNQLWRFDPSTGFLRCTAVMLQHSVMPYLRSELNTPSDVAPAAERLHVLVPRDAITDQASISSLEGAPATVGHIWQSAANDDGRCGAVAGAPYFDGTDLVADILVTDASAARRIMLPAGDPDKLEEISTAFDALVNWEPGNAECGPYDGYFSGIRYNHVAILPAGHARGGGAVRIVNTTEHDAMPAPNEALTLVRIKLPSGRTVRVHNEDAAVAEEDTKATEDKLKNAADPAKTAELMAQLEELNKQLQDITGQRDEIAGQLQALKDQLDAALGADAVEKAAEEMAADRDDAEAVMNSRGLKLTAEDRKLRGHALRLHVVNSCRAAPLTDEDAKNEPFVKGLYAGIKGSAPATPPAGHKVVNSSGQDVTPPAGPLSNAARAERLYGPKKPA